MATPAAPSGTVASVAGVNGSLKDLKPAQNQARKLELRRCRRISSKAKRGRCIKQVKTRYRRIARRQAKQPAPTAVHDVLITDTTTKPIQLCYFIPVETMQRDNTGRIVAPEVVPTTLNVKVGEAVRFIWDESNQHHSQTVAATIYPPGVNRFDFFFGSAPVHGDITFQRTFTTPGFYRFIGGLQVDTQLLDVTVNP